MMVRIDAEFMQFIEQNSTQKQNNSRRLICNYLESDKAVNYHSRLCFLKESLHNYRSMDPANLLKQLIDMCCKVDEQYCRTFGKWEDIRHHNILILRYIRQNRLADSHIAAVQYIDKRTVYKDLDKAIKSFMIFTFGIDGVKWWPKFNHDATKIKCNVAKK